DAIRRDDVAGKRQSGERVQDRPRQEAEIAGALLRGRHDGLPRQTARQAVPFIRTEEERPVLTRVQARDGQRSTDRSAVLVLAERRRLALREEVGTLKSVVARELPNAAAQLVGPGLGDHLYHRPGIASELRREVAGL